MDINLGILNKNQSYSNSSSFEMEQLDNGEWRITVDGRVVHKGEFGPFKVEIED